MDVREKLVGLFRNAFAAYGDGITGCTREEFFADFIAGYGVTVQEWISVNDRLPEDMADVLTCDVKGNIHTMWHHNDFLHPFNIGRNDLRYYPVTHWMPLPQPPKE